MMPTYTNTHTQTHKCFNILKKKTKNDKVIYRHRHGPFFSIIEVTTFRCRVLPQDGCHAFDHIIREADVLCSITVRARD